MDCRKPLTLMLTGPLWLALAAVGHCMEPPVPAVDVVHVVGGDFPVLVQVLERPMLAGDVGSLLEPGCADLRARRIDELPLPWRRIVDRVHLDCERVGAESSGLDMIALASTAYLKPGTVRMAGNPVIEVRLMDSELWGDHQYVLDADYASVAADLRALVESRCAQQQMREEDAGGSGCSMTVGPAGLYLSTDDISGVWIHADPDNPQRTVYAEAWAD